uniref:Uncharacterized protein n=1 Tax=Cucumis melo TaxID=3656 RepID=A0A9I9EGP5_CUCME
MAIQHQYKFNSIYRISPEIASEHQQLHLFIVIKDLIQIYSKYLLIKLLKPSCKKPSRVDPFICDLTSTSVLPPSDCRTPPSISSVNNADHLQTSSFTSNRRPSSVPITQRPSSTFWTFPDPFDEASPQGIPTSFYLRTQTEAAIIDYHSITILLRLALRS